MDDTRYVEAVADRWKEGQSWWAGHAAARMRESLLYLVAIAAGILVTTGAIFVLTKRPVAERAEESAEQPEEKPVVTA